MRSRIEIALCVFVCATWSVAAPATATAPETAAALWGQMRRADLESAQFYAAKARLTALLGTTPANQRTALATAMMDAQAEDHVNAAAVEMLGPDPLPVADVQRMLWDPQRSGRQRELLKTYYSFCRPEAKASVLSEAARRHLVDILAERLDSLAGTNVGYGEQRLLVHLCSAVLGRYGAAGAEVAQAAGLLKAMAKYADKSAKTDSLAAAIATWLDLCKSPPGAIDTFAKAAQAVGHWDPVVQWKAAAWLGEKVPGDPQAARVVQALLGDVRDEVRAAAARALGFAKDYQDAQVVPHLAALVTGDRGVTVQTAAAEALIARADQADGQIEPLLAAFDDPLRKIGDKRASSILIVLARLAKRASPDQRQRMLVLAVQRLAASPQGALAVLEALGPDARKALPSLHEYRATADRFERAYIDRHVRPAILPAMPE